MEHGDGLVGKDVAREAVEVVADDLGLAGRDLEAVLRLRVGDLEEAAGRVVGGLERGVERRPLLLRDRVDPVVDAVDDALADVADDPVAGELLLEHLADEGLAAGLEYALGEFLESDFHFLTPFR